MAERRNLRTSVDILGFSNKKSKYTATDREIMADLDKLKYFPSNILKNINKLVDKDTSIPQKRIRNSTPNLNQQEMHEEEVIKALVSLISSNSSKMKIKKQTETKEKHLQCRSDCTKFFKSTKDCRFYPVLKNTNYRSEEFNNIVPTSQFNNLKSKSYQHVEISWITNRLKDSIMK